MNTRHLRDQKADRTGKIKVNQHPYILRAEPSPVVLDVAAMVAIEHNSECGVQSGAMIPGCIGEWCI